MNLLAIMVKSRAEIANFQSKLEEFAVFTEAVFQGDNESYKAQLLGKVGHFFRKRINSCLPINKLGFLNKKARKQKVKIDLPDELWIKILGYMKIRDVFQNFALTCKRFNNLSLDSSIIKSLHLSHVDEIDYEYVLKVIKRSKFMTKIEINECKLFADIISTSLKLCPKLKSITIKNEKMNKNQITNVNKLLEKYGKNLEFLSLDIGGYSTIKDNMIKELTNLKVLDLQNYDTKLYSKHVFALAKNPNMESLRVTVSCDKDTNLAFKAFLKATVKTLKELQIKHEEFDNYDFNASHTGLWTKYLTMSQSLKRIEIENGSRLILKNISVVPKLKFLKLDSIVNHRSKDISFLFEKLDLEAMEELAIFNINISLENFTSLANRKCPKLKHICFDGCTELKLDEHALKKMISNSPQLELIHVMDSDIDLTNEQLYQLKEQNGVSIGVSNEKDQQLKKFKRYKLQNSAPKYSPLIICELCNLPFY